MLCDAGFGMGGVWWVILCVAIMLAMLALIVVGMVLLAKGLSGWRGRTSAAGPQGHSAPGSGSKHALQILEGRYARGDINREEFM